MRYSVLLRDAQSGHAALSAMWPRLKAMLLAGHPLQVEVREETRSTAQNRRMWAMLADISRQVDWYGNKLTGDDWKDVLTASLRKERVVPGINGGFVVLGQRTSQMSIREMSELIDLAEAFGTQKGVQWTLQREETA